MTWHVFIPDSLLEETHDPKLRAYKVGQIARAAAIFGVEHIWIYRAGGRDGRFIKTLLEYAETPQYLRKRLFPLMPELRYAGVMPPLQIPSHKPKESPRIGEIREGFAYRKGKKLFADIGLDRPALVKGVAQEGRGTFKVISVKPLRVVPTKPEGYWGYKVHLTRMTLAKTLKKANLDVVIATSRKGVDVRRADVTLEGDVGIVFGSPRRGVMEILREFNEDYEFDVILNTIPGQKTKTVRTEEAVLATLAVLNLMRGD
ncbi:putative RNA uridine N3 methyltransferase [Pyrococcus yayanosii]|uniref:putative RNA uridine N3 methyltransferase n=1 Tax=Pyrococcus yayanosii TaxID=1008460 RepID=UPI00064E7A3D|nr:putative RNA uridine N3 methyltransferase [Pyrococcus yayanosii]